MAKDQGFSRRDFLKTTGGLVLASAATPWGAAADTKLPHSESKVVELYRILDEERRQKLCFAYDDPLRQKVAANWAITEPSIDDLTLDQQDLVEEIVKGLTSKDGYEKFMQQMADDHGGLGSYHIAIFGKPGEEKFEFVLTGRHVTMRADGNSREGAAFGGPMVYGHDAGSFTEPADHPGNVFWYQGVRANEVFSALDGKQREKALLGRAPAEDQIALRDSGYPGLPVEDMTADQKELVHKVMHDLLSPYRKEDADEVMKLITANGGLERIHLAFFKLDEGGKNADLGNDGIWDVWRLEGPGFVWHFRGAPHVHTWVNIGKA